MGDEYVSVFFWQNFIIKSKIIKFCLLRPDTQENQLKLPQGSSSIGKGGGSIFFFTDQAWFIAATAVYLTVVYPYLDLV